MPEVAFAKESIPELVYTGKPIFWVIWALSGCKKTKLVSVRHLVIDGDGLPRELAHFDEDGIDVVFVVEKIGIEAISFTCKDGVGAGRKFNLKGAISFGLDRGNKSGFDVPEKWPDLCCVTEGSKVINKNLPACALIG